MNLNDKYMKNRFLQFTIAILVVLFFGCSTSSDGNGNSTTSVIPIVPANLTGELVNNQVVLNWNDSSTNETGFKIDRKEGTASWSVNYATVATDIETYTDASVTAGSSYTYRVYSYNSVGPSLGYSNTVTVTVPTIATLATITTTAVSSITTSTATSGGTITNDGGAPITTRGIVWSNLPNPTIDLPTKTTEGSGIGTFTSSITGLNPNWDYHVRAYATNSAGTAYGNEVTFTSLQNTVLCDDSTTPYLTVTIGGQIWMQKNLNVCKYRNGDDIPQVQDPTAWSALTTGAWCYYENNTANGPIYGKLYNWYAVNDPRGLAPIGYHIPSDAEWTQLTTFLGGTTIAGGKMKEVGLAHWVTPNTAATNESGFTGLPGGYRSIDGGFFISIGRSGNWWSSTALDATIGWSRSLSNTVSNVYRSTFQYKQDGISVRCIKD